MCQCKVYACTHIHVYVYELTIQVGRAEVNNINYLPSIILHSFFFLRQSPLSEPGAGHFSARAMARKPCIHLSPSPIIVAIAICHLCARDMNLGFLACATGILLIEPSSILQLSRFPTYIQ